MRTYIMACALAVVASCGDDDKNPTNDDTKLDCAWFEGDNCWKQGVQEAAACIDATVVGTLSGDRLSCTFGGASTIVTFDDAVPSDNALAYDLSFILTINSQKCMSLKEGADIRLETNQGAVVADFSGSSYNMSCPGVPVLTADLQSLTTCDVAHLPGFRWNADPGFFEVFLTGGPGGSADLLFECQP